MTEYTIFALEEQNLRVDTQDGVCGVIPNERGYDALVAVYLLLADHDKEKVHKKIKQMLEANVVSAFVNTMLSVTDQLTHPKPEGGIEL